MLASAYRHRYEGWMIVLESKERYRIMEKSKVYFTKEITPESLAAITTCIRSSSANW